MTSFLDMLRNPAFAEECRRLLAEVENEVAKQLTAVLNDDPRLSIETSAKIKAIKGEPGNMKVSFEDAEGKSRNFGCDYVIMATGKRPVLDGLELDKAGVKAENSGA